MLSTPPVPLDLSVLNINYWALQTLAMMLTALLIPRLTISGPLGALGTVVALGFINSKIWDTQLFSYIPNTFSSQALALFVVNGIIFWILVKVLPGIEVSGFIPAFVAPIVFTVCSMFINQYAQHIDWIEAAKSGMNFTTNIRDQFREVMSTTTTTTVPKGGAGEGVTF